MLSGVFLLQAHTSRGRVQAPLRERKRGRMSTNIPNGLRITPQPGRTVFSLAGDIRECMKRVAYETSHQTIANHVVSALTGAHTIDTYHDLAARALLDAARAEPDDVRHAVELFPTEGPDLLAIPTGRLDFSDALQELPGVEAYGYWDHSDQPAGISDEEWVRRGTTWDAAVGAGPICDYGITVELASPYHAAASVAVGTYDTRDWTLVGQLAFEDPALLAERATLHALLERIQEMGSSTVRHAMCHQPMTVFRTLQDQAAALAPAAATVPAYDPARLRTSDALEPIAVTVDDESFNKTMNQISGL